MVKPWNDGVVWMLRSSRSMTKARGDFRAKIKYMRLTPSQIETICSTARQLLGTGVKVTLFGSRVDDNRKGGDVDLMVEVPEAIDDPALISARMASRVSRAMEGRKVDVVLKAPNLMLQPIHQIAQQTGVVL